MTDFSVPAGCKEKLFRAVLRQLGYKSFTVECKQLICDISRGGVGVGWPGFISTDNAATFTRRNRRLILWILAEMAEQSNATVTEIIARGRKYDGCVSRISVERWLIGIEQDEDNCREIENIVALIVLEWAVSYAYDK